MENKTDLITGANGFLGKALSQEFQKRGYVVRKLVRAPAGENEFHFELNGQVDESAFEGKPQALIHCAYALNASSKKELWTTNVEGANKLYQAAKTNGIGQFVFISSMAAHEAAQSTYGLSKLAIEKTLNPTKDTIIRPGTIIGDGGLFNRTRALVKKVPILPVFYAGERKFQTVWINDLTSAVAEVVDRKLAGAFNMAEYPGVSVKDFYRALATREGVKPRLLTVPGDLVIPLLKPLEALGLKLPVNSDNVLGMRNLRPFQRTGEVDRLGVTWRTFEESLNELYK